MRDPLRIPRILKKLEVLWRINPDMRLGQLMENINLRNVTHTDTFCLEDEILEERIDQILSTGSFTP